jgi:hypothetical protein
VKDINIYRFVTIYIRITNTIVDLNYRGLRVILTVNYNTFCFATIDKVFYLVAFCTHDMFRPLN